MKTPLDFEKMAQQLLSDIRAVPGGNTSRELFVVKLYLEQSYLNGKEHGWWEDREAAEKANRPESLEDYYKKWTVRERYSELAQMSEQELKEQIAADYEEWIAL